jgi:hypothetical protein
MQIPGLRGEEVRRSTSTAKIASRTPTSNKNVGWKLWTDGARKFGRQLRDNGVVFAPRIEVLPNDFGQRVCFDTSNAHGIDLAARVQNTSCSSPLLIELVRYPAKAFDKVIDDHELDFGGRLEGNQALGTYSRQAPGP